MARLNITASKARTLGLLAPSAPVPAASLADLLEHQATYEFFVPWGNVEDNYLREVMCTCGTDDGTIDMHAEEIGRPFEDVQARMAYLSSLPYLGGPPPKSEVR